MKVFQIINGKCWWDATAQFPTVSSTEGFFPPADLFVEAPDEVQEGWRYIDGEFLPPEPAPAPEERYTADDLLAALLGTLPDESGGGVISS